MTATAPPATTVGPDPGSTKKYEENVVKGDSPISGGEEPEKAKEEDTLLNGKATDSSSLATASTGLVTGVTTHIGPSGGVIDAASVPVGRDVEISSTPVITAMAPATSPPHSL